MRRFVLDCAVALSMAAAIFVMAGQVGCKTNTATPAAPADPPQVTVLKYAQLGATSVDAAAHTLVVLCVPQAPATVATLDSGTCSQIKTYLTEVTNFLSAAGLEASGADPWPAMRVKIALAAAQASISVAVQDPTLKAELSGLASLITQIVEVQ